MEIYNYLWLLQFSSFGITNEGNKLKQCLLEIMKVF